MRDVDPYDVGMVLAVPAFLGSVASFVYPPAFALVIPLCLGILAALLWGFFHALTNVWGDLRA